MTGEATRVVLTGDGPVLIYGPVEVELPDGRRVRSERAVTALCTCGRTRRRPFCDTSHRDTSHRDTSHRDTSHRDTSHRDTSHRLRVHSGEPS